MNGRRLPWVVPVVPGNVSGRLDAAEILGGEIGDSDGDGVPDACESLGGLNGDGVVDGRDPAILPGNRAH